METSLSAKTVFEQLRERAIIARYYPVRRLDNALRITVRTEDEADALLGALREIVGK